MIGVSSACVTDKKCSNNMLLVYRPIIWYFGNIGILSLLVVGIDGATRPRPPPSDVPVASVNALPINRGDSCRWAAAVHYR